MYFQAGQVVVSLSTYFFSFQKRAGCKAAAHAYVHTLQVIFFPSFFSSSSSSHFLLVNFLSPSGSLCKEGVGGGAWKVKRQFTSLYLISF